MKNVSLALPFLLAAVPAAAQNQIRARITAPPAAVQDNQNSSTRGRIVAANNPSGGDSQTADVPKPMWGDSAVSANPRPPLTAPVRSAATEVPKNTTSQPKLVKPTSLSLSNPAPLANVRSAHAAGPTSIYRVGIGDVLDIHLANVATRESTLFTVMKNGYLEYPLLAAPIAVAGLTPDEIARRLTTEIKVIQAPRPLVSVRDYASHTVVISGAVDNPGRKTLRREAVPLFTILAQALPRPDASTATVLRNGKEIALSLARSEDLSTLVVAGDVIRVSTAAKQFVYVGGDVASAGEKELREGMTLTQLILVAGGVRADVQNKVKVTRRDANGFLKSDEYNLRAIEGGKSPDPLLQPGDRIEVRRVM